MNKFFPLFGVLVILYGCGAAKKLPTIDQGPIAVSIDLLNVKNDQVQVIVDPGSFLLDNVVFRIPKTVPGTYSSDDYGQYVVDFMAVDYKGNAMPVQKLDINSWAVANAKQLDKVIYKVNDTYDSEDQKSDPVFSPAGTNILAGDNFMLNLHAFVGYFDAFKERPYRIVVTKPENLVSTTSLPKVAKEETGTQDVFSAGRYFEVIDNPVLYAKENKISFTIQGITVNLSVYSPNNVYKATDLKERMEKMMGAQKSFLGNINSTKVYNILLYLAEIDQPDATGYGALEHHTSTVVVLPEAMPKERLEQAMVDVVSHEFFHIVTPLSVHSKEIQFFDFNDPKMSQHLWMYEGTTEYFANLFQVNQGLITEEEFYDRMLGKIDRAKGYDDAMSFTVMSKHILEEPYEENYANVYEKGALINMVLDIILREQSKGEKGVLWLMKELSKKYGEEVPFNDDGLINEIVGMTYPEVGTFFAEHVIGNTPIDYSFYLAKVGLAMVNEQKNVGFFFDGEVPFIDVDEKNENTVFVRSGIELNSSMENLGLQAGDIITSINGTPVDLESMRSILVGSFSWTPDQVVSFQVHRNEEDLKLEGPVGKPTLPAKKMVPVEGVSPDFAILRKAWLKGK